MSDLNLNRYRKKSSNDEDQILPLINIVFLLLIFFMIAGRLSTADPFPLELASSQSDRRIEAKVAHIHLGPQGTIYFEHVETTRTELAPLIQTHLQNFKDGQFRLKVDHQQKAQDVIRFLNELRTMGVEKVLLATQLDIQK